MIYLDNGATSFHKPQTVSKAMQQALQRCANPGRGGYTAAMEAAKTVLCCRELAGRLFGCKEEQVVFTSNCTHGLNIALRTLIRPGDRVAVSGFEHNAVTRTLQDLGARQVVFGRKLFDWEDTLTHFEETLRSGISAAVFTHVSNVFGYILPVEEMAKLCRQYRVPFVIDAAQSAGSLSIDLTQLGADFVAMPGHKGLLGPQGAGLLLCGQIPKPLLTGGTGSLSSEPYMPDFLPDRAEAGTLNVPGIAGLCAGLQYLEHKGIHSIFQREQQEVKRCARQLNKMGFRVFTGPHQAGTVSFLPETDCEVFAQKLAQRGIAVRAGLHCAPLAHESAGTLQTGTVRISYGHDADPAQTDGLLRGISMLGIH